MIQYFNILMYYVLNGEISEKFYPTLIVWYRYIREPKIGLGMTTTSTQYYSQERKPNNQYQAKYQAIRMYAVLLQRLHKICRINYFCEQSGAINLHISTFKVLQGFRTLFLLHDNQLVFSIKDYQAILHRCPTRHMLCDVMRYHDDVRIEQFNNWIFVQRSPEMGLIERTPCKIEYWIGRVTYLKRENLVLIHEWKIPSKSQYQDVEHTYLRRENSVLKCKENPRHFQLENYHFGELINSYNLHYVKSDIKKHPGPLPLTRINRASRTYLSLFKTSK